MERIASEHPGQVDPIEPQGGTSLLQRAREGVELLNKADTRKNRKHEKSKDQAEDQTILRIDPVTMPLAASGIKRNQQHESVSGAEDYSSR